MEQKDKSNMPSKRKAEESSKVRTKTPRTDSAGDGAPPGATEQELREQIEMLSAELNLSRQQNVLTQQEVQRLRDVTENNREQLAEEARQRVRNEQLVQSLNREIAELRARNGVPAPPSPTVMAKQDSQQHDQMDEENSDEDQLPVLVTDND